MPKATDGQSRLISTWVWFNPITDFCKGVLSPLYFLDHRLIRMECPRCKGDTIKRGTYRVVRSYADQKRYYCKKCNYNFTERKMGFNMRKHPYFIREEIKQMYKEEKGYIKKYDMLKKPTYSTREIAEKFKVSKSFVYDVVKDIDRK